MSLRIVTDSNCDLPEELVAEHGIAVVPLYINIGTEGYRDGIDMSRIEFYEGLPHFKSYPTTSAPSPGQFYQLYERLAHEGATGILSIHISSNLSAVANSARLAAEEFSAVPLRVFDSGQLTLGTGLQVLTAARTATAGRTLDEILAILEDQRKRTFCFAALDTLEFLRRSGRLSRFQASLGSLLQLKPVIKMHDGIVDLERVRTSKHATDRVIELVDKLGSLEELHLVHSHAPERAEALRQQAHHLFPNASKSLSVEVTPVIGAHIGPGAVGFVALRARKP